MSLTIRHFAFACFLSGIASASLAEFLEIDISVLDPESFALGAPTDDTRWVIEGEGDFLLVEQHGAMPSMRFDLPAGEYRVTVWELSSEAVAEQIVTLPEGETAQVALMLTPMNSSLIDDALARTNEPEPNANLVAPRDDPGSSQVAQESTVGPPLGLTIRPLAVFTVTLPDIADAANDRVAVSDGGAGWIWTLERGSLDAMALTAPETPGRYTVDYIEVPEMTVLRQLEVRVR